VVNILLGLIVAFAMLSVTLYIKMDSAMRDLELTKIQLVGAVDRYNTIYKLNRSMMLERDMNKNTIKKLQGELYGIKNKLDNTSDTDTISFGL